MFLVPLIIGTTCDICTIYIYHETKLLMNYNELGYYDIDDDSYDIYDKYNDKTTFILNQENTFINFILLTDITRLACIIPYLFYLSSGRRIKGSWVYKLFHIVCIFIIIIHLLFKLLTINNNNNNDDDESSASMEDIIDNVWLMITLSIVGCVCHILMLYHVGSTAPEEIKTDGNTNGSRMIAYAAAWRYTAHWEDINGLQQQQQQQEPFFKKLIQSKNDSNNKYARMIDDEFIKDLQKRLSDTQRRWTTKLEELKRSTSTNLLNRRGVVMPQLQFQNRSSSFHTFITPFRVLLHLYAYKDVLTNGELDSVFSMNNGSILTFYIPQLVSFLLHGAYLNAPQLEYWILERCSENICFAHKIFWFLRGWCLQTQNKTYYEEDDLLDMGGNHNHSSNPSHANGIHNVSKYPIKGISNTLNKRNKLRSLSVGAELVAMNYERTSESTIIVVNEDHRIIENLMLRVMDRAEKSAYLLMHGTNKLDNNNVENNNQYDKNYLSSPFAVADAIKNGHVPIDPTSGRPSTKHLDAITASSKYNFLPLTTSSSSSNNNQYLHYHTTDNLFLSTPQFFDALLSIADNLMLVSKLNRTYELRILLKQLEYDLLPNNVIYIPLNDGVNRIWRIVSTESIALSTKERVPCFVTLETVSFDANYAKKDDNNINDDQDVLCKWQTNERPPQRFNTFLQRMKHTTTRGIKKIQGDVSNHMKNITCKNNNTASNALCATTSVACSLDATSASSHHFNEDNNNHNDFIMHDYDIRHASSSLFTPPPPPSTLLDKSHNNFELSNTLLPTYYEGDTTLLSNHNNNCLSPHQNQQQQKSDHPLSPQVVSSAMGQWVSPPTKKRSNISDNNDCNSSMPNPPFYTIPKLSSPFPMSPIKRLEQPSLISNKPSYDTLQISSSDDSEADASIYNVTTPIAAAATTTIPAMKTIPPTVVFKENWSDKSKRLRQQSAYGKHAGWRLLPILIKSNDDLRQEQLAAQLIRRMATILARANTPVWLYPYEILALTHRGGIIEAVPDTISLDSLKRNDPHFISLKNFFDRHFAPIGSDAHANARANFIESLAAYSIVCYLLQIKDRHNGNILLDNKGHIVHIDFGFLFLSSPGQNSGFEKAPFKLTTDFVSLMDGPDSRLFLKFRDLCVRTFLELRKHCYQIILMVEMITEGNSDLPCFCGKPKEAIQQLRHRFRLDLSDSACVEYVNSLIDESLENWRTRWYDRYQRFCVGVL